MGVFTPNKGDGRVNGNVAVNPIDAASITTLTTTIALTTTTTTTTTKTTSMANHSAINDNRFALQSESSIPSPSPPQKKARKTMPSGRKEADCMIKKEAECIMLSPTKEESCRTVTPGKIRKRASMGGSASKNRLVATVRWGGSGQWM